MTVADKPDTGAIPGASATVPADDAQFAAAMEDMRKHLRYTSAALGAVATTVIGGLGWAKLNDIFPIPAEHYWRVLLMTIFGAALAIAGSIFVAGGFFTAQRRIIVSSRQSREDQPDPLAENRSKKESELARYVMNEFAWEENAADLLALDLRAQRMARVARNLSIAATRFSDESERLNNIVKLALQRTCVVLLERRSRKATSSWSTKTSLAVAVVGIVLLWGAADYSAGQHALIGLRKDCSAAVAAGAAGACDSVETPAQQSRRRLAQDKTAADEAARVEAAKAALPPVASGVSEIARTCATAMHSDYQSLPAPAFEQAVSRCIRLATR